MVEMAEHLGVVGFSGEDKSGKRSLRFQLERSAERIEMNTKMYVGNLPFSTTENELRGLFESYGPVTDIHLPMDRESGRPRGFAFVTMDSEAAMNGAVSELNAKDWNGRTLAVNEARPRDDRPSSGPRENRAEKNKRW